MILAGIVGDHLVRAWGRPHRLLGLARPASALGAVALTLARQPVLTIGSVLLMGTVGLLALVLIPAVLADRHGSRRHPGHRGGEHPGGCYRRPGRGADRPGGTATPAGWRGPWLLILLVPLALFARFRAVSLPPAPLRVAHRQRGARLPAAYWAYWVTVVLAVGVEFSLIFWGADFLAAAEAGCGRRLPPVGPFLWGMVAGRLVGRHVAQRLAAERLRFLSRWASRRWGFSCTGSRRCCP